MAVSCSVCIYARLQIEFLHNSVYCFTKPQTDISKIENKVWLWYIYLKNFKTQRPSLHKQLSEIFRFFKGFFFFLDLQMNSRHPRLLTVLETSVLSTSTTVTLTTTALEVRELQFTSTSVSNTLACWPIYDLLATIPSCAWF